MLTLQDLPPLHDLDALWSAGNNAGEGYDLEVGQDLDETEAIERAGGRLLGVTNQWIHIAEIDGRIVGVGDCYGPWAVDLTGRVEAFKTRAERVADLRSGNIDLESMRIDAGQFGDTTLVELTRAAEAGDTNAMAQCIEIAVSRVA